MGIFNMKGMYVFLITMLISLIALLIFLAGLPNADTNWYNDIVCKKWSTKWELNYSNRKCYKLVEIK